MDYQFPLEQQTYIDCLWPDVKSILQAQRKEYNVKCPYRFILSKKKYVYAKCSKCRAQLKFRKDQENTLKLISFSNKHYHSIYSDKQQNLNIIKNYIKQLPTNIQTRSAKKLVMQKFQIKESKFYYLYNQIIHPQMSFFQVIQLLNKQDYTVYTDPWVQNMNFLPDLLIAISPKMKQNYRKFGQWISLDFTYNLIRQQKQGRSWKVGSILGLSSTKRIVPFGLVITIEETTQRYYEIFKSFFQIMRLRPQTIITDQAISIISAIQQLKKDREFKGQHLLDAYHILKNAKKRLKDKSLRDHLKNLIHCRTKQEFQEQLQVCYKKFNQNDMEVLRAFIQNSKSYCFSQINPTMFGFTSSDSINQKINDLIKSLIIYSKPYTNVLTKTLRLMEQLGKNAEKGIIQNVKVQDFFGYPEIKQIRCMLDRRVFKEFTRQLSKIHRYEILQDERMNDVSYFIKKGNFLYKISKNQQGFSCQCSYQNKTGLPCSHLLKFCISKQLRMSGFISKRWHLYKQQETQNKMSRPRITRRNKIK